MCDFWQKEERERRKEGQPRGALGLASSNCQSIQFNILCFGQNNADPCSLSKVKSVNWAQDKDHHCILDSEEVENATDGSYEIQMEGLK